MEWKVKDFDDFTAREWYAVTQVRESVYIVEQERIYPELDGVDLEAKHLLGIDGDGKIATYARIYETEHGVSFGRVLVSPDFRGKGLSKQLVAHILQVIARDYPDKDIVIDAQEYIQRLYASFGFEAISGVHEHIGTPHVTMRLAAADNPEIVNAR
ncbi:GNAT family N-acetyltransferase [Levilactobacillus bambusae]|uniref:GNAT family N-acetyltransferase n=1 Tax=Levilactobacillus bambusae TaxID=2024736 RepID=A0A2V1N1F4_9LACO|nr:GNAT family N-acetyltransferase [Levilactobacillus bambusae]PWG00206.1 GNAT family N-acetyltransferase [Levilactobacillus bambusae]